MASYAEVQRWVKRHYGWLPKTCWIAHVKELNGLPVRTAWNRRGSIREVPCPPDKRPAIEEAFRGLGMMD